MGGGEEGGGVKGRERRGRPLGADPSSNACYARSGERRVRLGEVVGGGGEEGDHLRRASVEACDEGVKEEGAAMDSGLA